MKAATPSYRALDGALVSLDGVLMRYPAGIAQNGYSVPAGVKRIAQGAFQGCGNLMSIALPASLTAIDGDALSQCKNLASISVAAGSASFRARADALYDVSGTTLLRCPPKVPSNFTVPGGTEAIAPGAFAGCQDLITPSLPASIKSIGIGAFEGCSALAEVRFIGSKAEWSALIAKRGQRQRRAHLRHRPLRPRRVHRLDGFHPIHLHRQRNHPPPSPSPATARCWLKAPTIAFPIRPTWRWAWR